MRGTVLPEDIIARITALCTKMRGDHREEFAMEVVAIFDTCERAFANEFDAGYSLAQEEVGEWHESDPPDRD